MTEPRISVTVLGSSGTYADPGQACTGYLIRAAGRNVLVDCGPGAIANLQLHLDLRDVDGVILTHSHPDHWLDFPILRNALRYMFHVTGVPAFGTGETMHMAYALLHGEIAPTFEWTTIDEESEIVMGEQRWRFVRTDHPVETLAPRLDVDGASFAFSADTGPGIDAAALGPDLDLFLCEAALPNDFEGMAPHLSGRQAGRAAREAGARRLVVTHVVPGYDPAQHRAEAEAEFGAPVELATLGARFEI